MKYSLLNLVHLRKGQNYPAAFDDMIQLAQATEAFGYTRYWIAEHHNSPTIGSSATQVLIQHTLSQTQTIRVGSGGVMLPNHSPYLVAEQYGTIETLYPGRLDLGLGRAPGTDAQTARAIRRTQSLYSDFESEVNELTAYFEGTAPVHAYPAEGLNIPLYILGSSTDSAYLAAKLGRPYVFAAHFAPAMMEEAIAIYRDQFQASQYLDKPYVILALNAILAETDDQAAYLATSQTQAFLGIVSGQRHGILPPVENEETVWANYASVKGSRHFGPIDFSQMDLVGRERAIVSQMASVSIIGSPDTARAQLKDLHQLVQFDEIMANTIVYDQQARIESYRLLAQVTNEL